MTTTDAAPPRLPNEAAESLVWIDGRRADASRAGISPLDRGFTLADGLFETMRVHHGVAFRVDAHLQRLARGAGLLGIPVPANVPRTIAGGLAAIRELGWENAAIRLTLSRGVGARGVAPPSHAVPTVVMTVNELPPHDPLPSGGISVCTAQARRNEFAATTGVKTVAYVEAIVALTHAHAAGADDAIFLDTSGHLSEATSSNVFLVLNSALRTPPSRCGALPGITRAIVLELAQTLGISASEEVLSPHDLAEADEAFLTSSIRGLAPIRRVDGRSMPNGAPGPVTGRLSAAFAELVERECKP